MLKQNSISLGNSRACSNNFCGPRFSSNHRKTAIMDPLPLTSTPVSNSFLEAHSFFHPGVLSLMIYIFFA